MTMHTYLLGDTPRQKRQTSILGENSNLYPSSEWTSVSKTEFSPRDPPVSHDPPVRARTTAAGEREIELFKIATRAHHPQSRQVSHVPKSRMIPEPQVETQVGQAALLKKSKKAHPKSRLISTTKSPRPEAVAMAPGWSLPGMPTSMSREAHSTTRPEESGSLFALAAKRRTEKAQYAPKLILPLVTGDGARPESRLPVCSRNERIAMPSPRTYFVAKRKKETVQKQHGLFMNHHIGGHGPTSQMCFPITRRRHLTGPDDHLVKAWSFRIQTVPTKPMRLTPLEYPNIQN